MSAVLAMFLLFSACSYDHELEMKRQIRELSQHTSPFQQALLEDGVLTEDEYVSAYEALRECVREAGFEPSDLVSVDARGTLSFTYRGGPDLSDLSGVDECESRYTDMVGAAWAIQNAPTPSEADLRIEVFQQCLQARGMDTGDQPMDLETALDFIQPVGSGGYECGVHAGLVQVVLLPEPSFPEGQGD